jgi:hypothetical protein
MRRPPTPSPAPWSRAPWGLCAHHELDLVQRQGDHVLVADADAAVPRDAQLVPVHLQAGPLPLPQGLTPRVVGGGVGSPPSHAAPAVHVVLHRRHSARARSASASRGREWGRSLALIRGVGAAARQALGRGAGGARGGASGGCTGGAAGARTSGSIIAAPRGATRSHRCAPEQISRPAAAAEDHRSSRPARQSAGSRPRLLVWASDANNLSLEGSAPEAQPRPAERSRERHRRAFARVEREENREPSSGWREIPLRASSQKHGQKVSAVAGLPGPGPHPINMELLKP